MVELIHTTTPVELGYGRSYLRQSLERVEVGVDLSNQDGEPLDYSQRVLTRGDLYAALPGLVVLANSFHSKWVEQHFLRQFELGMVDLDSADPVFLNLMVALADFVARAPLLLER